MSSVTIEPSQYEFHALKDEYQFSAEARDQNGNLLSVDSISWSAQETNVATVDSAGRVTALSNGQTAIAASVGGVADTAEVIVDQVVATVSVTPSSDTLSTGSQTQLKAIPADSNGHEVTNATIRNWTSSDSSVATVDSTGLVEAISAGQATVTARFDGMQGRSGIHVHLTFSSVSVGQKHTCGLSDSGKAYCWGNDDAGQIGDGDNGGQTARPAPVSGGRTYADLTAGSAFSCAVASSGSTYCWGTNRDGYLGTGSDSEYKVPTQISSDPGFSQLSAGHQHTCGLTASGEAYCWGRGDLGQRGSGTASGGSPTAVSTSLTFNVIVAGQHHTCALTGSGDAYCWGYNEYGEVGDGTTEQRNQPVAVSGDHQFTEIAAGGKHTCALTDSGKAYCWGYGGSGQLGTDDTLHVQSPASVQTTVRFKDLYAGDLHTCGVSQDDMLYCWGNNALGRTGIGDGLAQDICKGGDTGCLLTPTQILKSETFSKAGRNGEYAHSCAVATDGRAYCWGHNEWGQVGDGTDGFGNRAYRPVPVVPPKEYK